MLDTKKIKEDFPIFENFRRKNGTELIYLDSAASSQTPRQVVEAMDEYYFEYRANVHRSPHVLSVAATQAHENARDTVAKFIGADSKEVIFTPGATIGMNMLVLMLEQYLHIATGDEIIVSVAEHHSNFIPLQELAKRRGAILQFIPLREADFDYTRIEQLLTSKTKIVAIPLASNVLGTLYDIKRIVQLAKEQGALVIVDATTAIGHVDVKVRDLGCDFLFFSGHKMLGPTGIGILYGRKDILELLQPSFYGGGVINTVTESKTIYRESPARFEAGTPNIAGTIGLARAVEYIEALGIQNIVQHTQGLVRYAHQELASISNLYVSSERHEGRNIGIVSFWMPKTNSMKIAESLGKEAIAIRGGYHCAMPLMKSLGVGGICRASFYIYNDTHDIDKLVESLKNVDF